MNKTMTLTELATLKKLMSMTTSTNDNEALVFLRKANGILTKHNLSWVDLLSKTVSATGSLGAAPAGDDVGGGEEVTLEEEIQTAFDEVRGNVSPDFAKFCDSLEDKFKRTKYLSQAERAPLYKAVRNLRERRKRDG